MVDSVRHPRSTLRLTPPSCAESGRKQSRVLLDGLSASSHLVRPRRPPPYRRVSRTVQVGARPAGLGMRRNNEGAHARDRFEHRLQVTAGLSIVLLAGWGLLATALTFRAFARLGMRAVGKRGGRMGLVRLLVGVSSILLNAAGARVIASLLPSKAAGLAWFLAAVAFLVYRGLRDMRRNMRLTRPLPVGTSASSHWRRPTTGQPDNAEPKPSRYAGQRRSGERQDERQADPWAKSIRCRSSRKSATATHP